MFIKGGGKFVVVINFVVGFVWCFECGDSMVYKCVKVVGFVYKVKLLGNMIIFKYEVGVFVC